jgi:post-segregation antitoxin (ccd killing protein)
MPNRMSIPRRRNKTANVTVGDWLVDQAQRQREEWLRTNRAALDAYNEHVEKHGVFGDGLRSF